MAKRARPQTDSNHSNHINQPPAKRCKHKAPPTTSNANANANVHVHVHAVLDRFYAHTASLRLHLASRLPTAATKRRRALLGIGHGHDGIGDDELALAELLDGTLVGTVATTDRTDRTDRDRDKIKDTDDRGISQSQARVALFEQQYGQWQTLDAAGLQSRIVDFAICWLYNHRPAQPPGNANARRRPHLLSYGYRTARSPLNAAHCNAVAVHANHNVDALQKSPWPQLLALLGPSRPQLMLDLLLDAGLFSRLASGSGNLVQLSGIPLNALEPANRAGIPVNPRIQGQHPKEAPVPLRPTAIRFVRSRILYSNPALRTNGSVQFGLRKIHVLSRYTDVTDPVQSVHVLKHVFPRQFGLHNVFTSKTDIRESALPFKDYTLRNDEIATQTALQAQKRFGNAQPNGSSLSPHAWAPKRLRGLPVALVAQLRARHRKCAYPHLLQHYCPIEGVDGRITDTAWQDAFPLPDPGTATTPAGTKDVSRVCFTDLASPTAHVSAFCRAVIAHIVPDAFWGDAQSLSANRRTIMRYIDRFVCMRRQESPTLHEVTQGLNISAIPWLRPVQVTTQQKMSRSDFIKRQELLLEFIYYTFDSLLVPLIRAHFYVTESNTHKNRLFYFRHDVWQRLSLPSLSLIRLSMFEPMDKAAAMQALQTQALGFSQVRLLPKAVGARPIMNLRRRQTRPGTTMLGPSINSLIKPAFNVLKYEKTMQPERLGSSIFSVAEIFPRLQTFRSILQNSGQLSGSQLYFCKVDVQSCFDTIPQKRLLELVEQILSSDQYKLGRHTEMRPSGNVQYPLGGEKGTKGSLTSTSGYNIGKKYVSRAATAENPNGFIHALAEMDLNQRNDTVFTDGDALSNPLLSKVEVMTLLKQHIECNIVKLGDKFYRQTNGIPQGSLVSSLLCNFFYAQLEQNLLEPLVTRHDTALFRLLDDFLFISVRREDAITFLQTMHGDLSTYGAIIKTDKTMVNFDYALNGQTLARPGCEGQAAQCFPYCGILIHTSTLEVNRTLQKADAQRLANSLTVDRAKVPGQTFHRKALNAFKIQMHGMFVDVGYNSVQTVLTNLYRGFLEAGLRAAEYVKGLAASRQVSARVIIRTVENLGGLATRLVHRQWRKGRAQAGARQARRLSGRQVRWLACKAFTVAFQRKQSRHGAALRWLREELGRVWPRSEAEAALLVRVVGGDCDCDGG